MASKGQKFKKYTPEQKETILKEYISGESSAYLSKKYDVPSKTIRVWLFNIKHGKIGGKRGRPSEKNLTLEDYKERYEILKKYQAFLQARREKK